MIVLNDVAVIGDETDEQLLSAARSDSRALTELFRRHDDKLRAFVYGLTNAMDLDDVMQDTYMKTYKSLDSFRGESSFATWLHRVAYNTVIDRRRRTQLKLVNDDEAIEREVQPGPSTEDATATQLEVRDALAALPENQKVAVLMIDAHGFSYADVARVLDISENTVGVHLSRARKAIKSTLQDTEKS